MRRIRRRNIFSELGASSVGIGFSHVFNFFGFNGGGGCAIHFAGTHPIVFFGTGDQTKQYYEAKDIFHVLFNNTESW